MDVNLQKVHDRFVEIVARSLDMYDQQQEGVFPDNDRWIERYNGRPWSDKPPHPIEINRFRPVVQAVVSQLMMALDSDEENEARRTQQALAFLISQASPAIEDMK